MIKATKSHLEKIKKQIKEHDYCYYVLDDPQISDYKYDQLFHQLKSIEAQHPKWVTDDSPTQRVPGEVLSAFKKQAHRQAMLSLDNSYSVDEVFEFNKRNKSNLQKENIIYFCEPKLDGMAIELIYENGILTKAITRGDGQMGENILENIKMIKSIPLRLEHNKALPKSIDIRGEVVLFKKDFDKLNQIQKKEDKKLFANPRNAAAGTLRNLDPKITAARSLRIYCHGIGYADSYSIQDQSQLFNLFKQVGLPVFSHTLFSNWKKKWKSLKDPLCVICNKIEQVKDYYEFFEKHRSLFPFDVDGIVIKVHSFKEQKQLGMIARSPRWATALKLPPEEMKTQIEDIFVQIGRTGVLTPVAKMKSVMVGGVNVSYATLHNINEIQKKDIRLGDTVFVRRAGDVIPEVVGVDLSKRRKPNSKRNLFKMPSKCPSCKAKVVQKDDLHYCTNFNCAGRTLRRIQHFCSKKAMNIDSLGEKIIEILFDEKIICCFSDIYRLKKKDIEPLEGFGKKSATLIIGSIESSKKVKLRRFIFSLGIEHVGEQTALLITEHFGTGLVGLKKLIKADTEELIAIHGVGEVMALSLKEGLQILSKEIDHLFSLGVHLVKESSQKQKDIFKGVQIVVTGTMDRPRSDMESLVRQYGGKTSSSVSSKTALVVYGEKAGSKLKKAHSLKIKTMSLKEFYQKIGKN